eukprot:CAMPEP_0198699516 /NCGR_PEP_ID=MMETSP1468-20131203/354949_1 /TAXON_ID=1461545 /ORGANISM="Mantoniella sp, Strain CCMP1436" /LENGTH=73 /DNA_ID=CAMNT_0044457041 /DNA_START=258 /DNA_END=480 /DNA_ORIENTATION=+
MTASPPGSRGSTPTRRRHHDEYEATLDKIETSRQQRAKRKTLERSSATTVIARRRHVYPAPETLNVICADVLP